MHADGMETTDAAALAALDDLRARLGGVAERVADVQHRGATLADETAWRSRAAEDYRAMLSEWRMRLVAARLVADALDGELSSARARIVATGGAGS